MKSNTITRNRKMTQIYYAESIKKSAATIENISPRPGDQHSVKYRALFLVAYSHFPSMISHGSENHYILHCVLEHRIRDNKRRSCRRKYHSPQISLR
jgi:hypothetical protein